MPYLAPEKRAAGTWAPHPNDLPPLPRPDQTRYGPKPAPDSETTGIATTHEGGGTVTTCRVCGWLRFHETDQDAQRISAEHTCRRGDRCLACGPPYRLGKDGCPHLTPAKEPAGV
ncbi:hypothetical protein [Nocardioides sp. LML1-1-1.1]|uniref:hypothetical protein n=1 Tax=Nocardioides sp. LML1-1-1.1 TaxID=3135248 RepID=UPI0034424EEC